MENLIVLIASILFANWMICAFYTKEYIDLAPKIHSLFVLDVAYMWCLPIIGPIHVRNRIKELSNAQCGRDGSNHLESASRYDDWEGE
ncbi:hypothetical protein [Teredinibacter turnerae]|uniref:hypothetical protein n=1 Tax=Teredinibacter turnerae TaxID=2426 RepID=UPI0005A14EE9|nr:hypothetical protein [Teredinibacter turnerae]